MATLALASVSSACASAPWLVRQSTPAVLTRVAAVRNLNQAAAASSLPVRITGVVTALSGYKNSFFMQDESAGISVDRTDDAIVHVGDKVEIVGVTNAGSFAPVLMASQVRVVGRGEEPRAEPNTYETLTGGAKDSQWIEVRGVVHAAARTKVFDRDVLTLSVQIGSGRMRAILQDAAGLDGEALVDSTVSIRGVCSTTFNTKRQFVGLGMFVPRRRDVRVLVSGSANAFARPVTPVRNALQFGQSSHRIKVAGVVTYQEPGHLLYLQDARDGIKVETLSSEAVPIGTRVEALGFPVIGDYAPILQDGLFRVVGAAPPISPLRVNAREVISGHGQFDYVPYDEQLVQIEGQVVDSYIQAGQRIWLMQQSTKVFEVYLPLSSPLRDSRASGAGSTLRVTGICAVHATADRMPASFSILLRSAEDIVILRSAPWWTAARALLLLAALFLLVVGITLWVLLLRHRVRQQTRMLRESETRFRLLAQHDVLTGLPNRLMLEDRSSACLLQCRQQELKAAVFTIDIDRFKQINDVYGHPTGDECLKEVANRLRATVRRSDVIARTGGEEFTVIASGLVHEENARTLAAEMLQLFSKPVVLGGQEINLTISIGAALYPDDGDDAPTLRKRSDQALYQAKRTGRNRAVFATEELSRQLAAATSIESALREGLLSSSFFLVYQPIYDPSGAIRHLEALLRSRDPQLARIGPGKFILTAEETGLIIPLGKWVLEQVCQQIATWQRQGVSTCPVNVNVSARQLLKVGFAEDLLHTLTRFGVEPHMLQLELTETTAMKELSSSDNPVAELTRAGVTFAIDDFGTGYSSLARLRQLSIHTLKIDQSFLINLERNREYFSIILAIIQMARSLGMQVVAEGVESAQQYTILVELGCDLFQGFFFARPVPAAEASSMMGKNMPSRLAAMAAEEASADTQTMNLG